MKKQRKAYYSEALIFLPGHLHVTRDSSSIELSAKDEGGKRHLFSIPVSDTEALATRLWNEWEESGNGPSSGITLIEGCHPITSKEQLVGICEELSYVSDRADKVFSAIFHDDDGYVYLPDPKGEKRGSSINLEKDAPVSEDPTHRNDDNDFLEEPDTPEEDNSAQLASIMDSLKEHAENKESLASYSEALSHLKYNRLDPYAGMAKAVLLISVIDLLANGFIKSTKIPVDAKLGDKYEANWKRYVSTNVHNQYSSYEMPFIQMNEESFWRLMPNGVKPKGSDSLLSGYKCAVIEPGLYRLLKVDSNRMSLKTLLIDTYL